MAAKTTKTAKAAPVKTYAVGAEHLKPLAEGLGVCIATDAITVQGRVVGYCYREEADFDTDSGWRFTAGDETEAYMENPNNHGIVDVNLVANIDPTIVEFLDAPEGCAFERDPDTGGWVQVPLEDEEDDEQG